MGFFGGGSGGGGTVGPGTANTVAKFTAASTVGNSRITDNGTTIDANSGAGVFKAGDTSAGANGSFLKVDDANKIIQLSADDNNTGVSLTLNGTSTLVQITDGTGVGSISLNGATGDQFFGSTNFGIQAKSSTSSLNLHSTDAINVTSNSFLPATAIGLGSAAFPWGQLFIDSTITAGGTTGAQTINKSAGAVNFAAGASSLVVTSNKVTANSFVFAMAATDDTTAYVKNVVVAAGSFTIKLAAACTAETKVVFWILNE